MPNIEEKLEDRLEEISTSLNEVLDDCNEELANKGITSPATTLKQVPQKIGAIPTGGNMGANWKAQEGEQGFIDNKPFDVPTGIVLYNGALQKEEEVAHTYQYYGEFIFEPSESLTLDIENNIYVETVKSTVIDDSVIYYIGDLHLYTDNTPTSGKDPSYVVTYSPDLGESYIIYYHSTLSANSTAAVLLRGELSKLSATKLNIGEGLEADGDTLKAVIPQEVFRIRFDKTTNNEVSCSNTVQEIYEANAEGKVVIADFPEECGAILTLVSVSADEETGVSSLSFGAYIPNYSGTEIATVGVTYLASTDKFTYTSSKLRDITGAAGTYILKATKDSSGNITYQWVAE